MAKEDYVDPWVYTADEDKEATWPLKNARDLDPLINRIGNAHFVLLGEASHGTHEYYTWRTAMSKRLIEEKGFSVIAVEGDWPDCYKINRYVKGYDTDSEGARNILKTFDRWPSWMWSNWEIVALAEWLKDYNHNLAREKRIGFYGLDVYSLWESMQVMIDYLEQTDDKAASLAKKALACFECCGEDGQEYARQWRSMAKSCEEPVLNLLREIRKKSDRYDDDPEAPLNMEQNAHIAVNAEEYYRQMIGFSHSTWNLRDTHMVDTLNRIEKFFGTGVKVIVWEHNTHIGDARFTDMKRTDTINVGQLVREQKGNDDAILVGFGSYSGTVIAGNSWGAPVQSMRVPAARKDSIEAILHGEGDFNRLLIFNRNNKKERFAKELPHRAIGVVYDPAMERYGNYVPSILNSRYDAFVYIDKTKALHPLALHTDPGKTPETYPFNY